MQTPAELLGRFRVWCLHNWKELWWAFLFAIVCALGIEFGKDTWVGPATFKVYLVGNLADEEIQSVFGSFEKAAEKRKLEINGVPIEFQRRDDHGDPSAAVQIAKTLANAPDTLLVIGHVLTQETKSALPIYMAANPRIPVIATTETDDDLLSLCQECVKGFVPLVQMSPTNKAQSETAVKYAIEHGRKRFLLVSELNESNSVYSKNLMKDYREALRIYGFKGAIKVGEIEMGLPPRLDDLKQWNPDCVLYAGEHGTASTLVSALTGFSSKDGVTIILSDSAVNRDLQKLEGKAGQSILYTYPSDAAYYSRSMNVFGQDAFALLSALISGSDAELPGAMERVHHMFGMKRVVDARTDIIHNMQQNAEKAFIYSGESGDSYRFFGFRRDALFHVWEVQDGRVRDVDGWHAPKELH